MNYFRLLTATIRTFASETYLNFLQEKACYRLQSIHFILFLFVSKNKRVDRLSRDLYLVVIFRVSVKIQLKFLRDEGFFLTNLLNLNYAKDDILMAICVT